MATLSEDLYKNCRDRIQLSPGQPPVTEHPFCIRRCATCCKSTVMGKTALVRPFTSNGG